MDKTGMAPVESLSENQVLELREAFKMFDKDDDGFISTDELGTVMKSMGLMPTEAELMDMIHKMDADGNGMIDFEEFLDMMAKKMTEDEGNKEFHEVFHVLDTNGDGYITAHGLRQVMALMGQPLTEEEAEEMIREADFDNDGKVTYAEFEQLLISR